MVEIRVGDNLIYSSTLQHLKYVVQDICLKKQLNQADTLEMVVPDINVRKSLLTAGKSEIMMWVNGVRRFRGRLITRGVDFDKSIRVYCEGELAYLRDVMVRPYTNNFSVTGYLDSMLTQYNNILDDDTGSEYKKFTIGNVTVTGKTTTRKNEDYPTFLDELTEQLLNQYGGYLIPRYDNGVNKLDYVTTAGEGSQTIVYGKNLLDMKVDTDHSPLFTRLIPIGGTPESGGGDVPEPASNATTLGESESPQRTVLPEVYVENEAGVNQYGIIEHVEQYDDITDVSALREKALADLANGTKVEPQIEIAAVDMQNFDGSEMFDIGKTYKLISPAHGYMGDSRVLLVRMEEYPLQLDRSTYTFGAVKSGISYEAVQTNRAMNAVAKLAVDTAANARELLEQLKDIKEQFEDIQGDVAGIINYVTAESTTDGWNIRTWKNGKVDAWATKSATGLSFTDGVATKTFTLPTGAPVSGVITITGDKFANYTGAIANGVLTVTIKAVEIFAATMLNITIKGV